MATSKILLLYHYHWPDDVVSAQQFTRLGEALAAKGYQVEAWPCHWSRHLEGQTYSLKPETAGGVLIRRVWRPGLSQHRFSGRILNALWMEMAWAWRALFSPAPEALILGTDPIFSLFLVLFLKLRWPKTKIIHWCFDLYPEYGIAEGLVSEKGLVVRMLRALLRTAYSRCDLVADVGPCMRKKLTLYPIRRSATLTPGALEEPDEPLPIDPAERAQLFGDARLALLYSGNLSHPHEFYMTLKLALRMPQTAVLTYSARGNLMEALRLAVNPEYTNVRFAAFAPPEKLAVHLSAPDIHVVSLKASYTGVAVPSKFFGALAVGRPVLFEGEEESSIARWIREYGVGWVLNAGSLEQTVLELEKFSSCPKGKKEMFAHCHEVYQAHFPKKAVVDAWDKELKGLLG